MSPRTAPSTARVAGSLALAALVVSLAFAGSAAADSSNAAHPAPDDDTTTATETGSGGQQGTPSNADVESGLDDALLVVVGFLTGGLLVAGGVALGRWSR